MRFCTLVFALLLAACSGGKSGKLCPYIAEDSEWAVAKATVITTPHGRRQYLVSISYHVPESSSMDKKGKRITGIVEQTGIVMRKPKTPQMVCVKYLKSDPNIFVYLEDLKF